MEQHLRWLAEALLEKAEDLINKHIHPSVVVEGYEVPPEQALKLLQETGIKVDIEDKELEEDCKDHYVFKASIRR